jgi:uncharacterized metal-binding protein YceD (DUF177 family)
MKIRIHGIKDGKHNIELSDNVSNFPNIFPEFVGDVKLEGVLTKMRNRFNFEGIVHCNSKLICNISLEEFEQEISTKLELNYIIDTNLFLMKKDNSDDSSSEIVVPDDEEFVDITEDVKDVLVVSLPMKRISPKYIGKSFAEIYPQYSSTKKDDDIDARWAELKNISFD